LAHSDDAVTRIAFEAGYETHEAFSRAFRHCYSASPSAFRERRYPRPELSASNGVHFSHEPQPVRITFPNSGGTNMHVEIKTLPNWRLATVRHIGPYNQITEAFERLGQLAGPRGLAKPGTKMLALYHDDPDTTPQNELRSDAALVVDPTAELPAELSEQHLAAGRYAMTVHVGPYEQLGDTWARLMGQWLPASEHRLGAGVSFELYRNTPQDTPQHALETELYIPLA
jgi:AraC family transcriptional regulator